MFVSVPGHKAWGWTYWLPPGLKKARAAFYRYCSAHAAPKWERPHPPVLLKSGLREMFRKRKATPIFPATGHPGVCAGEGMSLARTASVWSGIASLRRLRTAHVRPIKTGLFVVQLRNASRRSLWTLKVSHQMRPRGETRTKRWTHFVARKRTLEPTYKNHRIQK